MKTTFPDFLDNRGITYTRAGHLLKILCPFHDDHHTPSLAVYPDGHAHCYGCDWHGDLIQFLMDLDGLSFAEACRILGKQTHCHGPSIRFHREEPEDEIYSLSQAEEQRKQRARAKLYGDRNLQQRIADSRGWAVETIHQLTIEDALGWERGAVAFCYETGMKLRSKWNGERRIRWAFGKPDLWRAFNLSKSVEVYLTEGESDAITLIDEGMEHPGYSCVVALPSASTFKPSWAKRFAGKRVALCFDNDRAGEEARDKVAGHLDGVAAEIKAIDWEAVA